ncbi:MAG: ATP-binding protein [Bacteroidia bacterium]
MKIKLKITLGVGLLFLLIILLSVLGAYYIHAINKDTQNILTANYNTLDYSRNMLITLDEDLSKTETVQKFSVNLQKQQKNVTEMGEKELTRKVSLDFESLKTDPANSALYIIIRKDLTDIMMLNMQAIERKSNVAKETANAAILWIAVTGMVCFLIAFILLVNLPGNIANPIKELTRSFKQIAAENYKERVHFEGHNEFGELANAFNVMAQKVEEYDNSKLAKILFGKKRIETLINKMHDPVIGLDEFNFILFVNEEGLRVTGMKRDELIGKNAKDISISNDLMRKLLREIIDDNIVTEQVKPQPLKIFANGKESYFEKELIDISVAPAGEHIMKNIGHVIILRNITPFKELDFAKTNFIATISHEFKTPISSIKMSVQLLNNGKIGMLNEEQHHLIESIQDDANRLLKITGELLNMTQIESGNIQISLTSSDPKEIIQYAIEANKIAAEQKRIKFDIYYPETVPNVLADSEKTAWVMTNLISNAIRYSYENSVIHIRIKNIESSVVLSVEDTGQGISPEYTDKVFNRYFKIPGTKKEGTGLGLAISKEFMEAQGGEIFVESDFGAGSIFSIKLKVA